MTSFSLSLAWEEGYFDSPRRWLYRLWRSREEAGEIESLSTFEGDKSYETAASTTASKGDHDTGMLKTMIQELLESILDTHNTTQTTPDNEHIGEECDNDLELNNVIIVASLGSMDDFVVYLTIALSGIFEWYELVLGLWLGATLISVFVASLLAVSGTFASYVALIPIPVVFLLLAVYIVVTAFSSAPSYP